MTAAQSISAKQLKIGRKVFCNSHWGRVCAGSISPLTVDSLRLLGLSTQLFLTIKTPLLFINNQGIYTNYESAFLANGLPHPCNITGSESGQQSTLSCRPIEKPSPFAKLHTTLFTFFYIKISALYGKAREFDTFQCNLFWSDLGLAGYFGRFICLQAHYPQKSCKQKSQYNQKL